MFVNSPSGKIVVSPADTSIVDEFGAAVVECSWARIAEVCNDENSLFRQFTKSSLKIPFARIGGRCERLRQLLDL